MTAYFSDLPLEFLVQIQKAGYTSGIPLAILWSASVSQHKLANQWANDTYKLVNCHIFYNCFQKAQGLTCSVSSWFGRWQQDLDYKNTNLYFWMTIKFLY